MCVCVCVCVCTLCAKLLEASPNYILLSFIICSQFIISDVLPFLGDADSVVHREGAIEVLACIL